MKTETRSERRQDYGLTPPIAGNLDHGGSESASLGGARYRPPRIPDLYDKRRNATQSLNQAQLQRLIFAARLSPRTRP